MTWCNSFNDVRAVENNLATAAAVAAAAAKKQQQQQASSHVNLIRTCPSCGHRAQYEQVGTLASSSLLYTSIHALDRPL
jgi:hypothetical protein